MAPSELLAAAAADETAEPARQWHAKSRLLYRYYVRDMADARKQRQLLYPDNHGSHIPRTVPFIARLARELGGIYLLPPSRTFTHTEPSKDAAIRRDGAEFSPEQVRFTARLYEALRVNERLRTMHEIGIACGNSVLLVWPRPELRGAYLCNVPPHLNSVDMGANVMSHDEKDVERWWMRLPVRLDKNSHRMVYATAVLTPAEAYWHDGPLAGQGLFNADPKDISNPLGEVPAIAFRRHTPALGSFMAEVCEDLLDSQRAINHDFTDAGQISRMQGFSQAVARGVGAEAKIELGPDTVLKLSDPEASFGFERPDADLEGIDRAIKSYMRVVGAANGLNPGSLDKSTAVTALGKQHEVADRAVEQMRHKIEFQRVENRLYSLLRKWSNLARVTDPAMTPEERIEAGPMPRARVVVEHTDLPVPTDRLHDAQASGIFLSAGLTSRAEERAALRGTSVEEAQAWVDAHPVAAPVEPGAASTAGTLGDADGQTLNGAQITAVLEVAGRVAAGAMTPEAAISLLEESLGLSPGVARRVIEGSDTAASAQLVAP